MSWLRAALVLALGFAVFAPMPSSVDAAGVRPAYRRMRARWHRAAPAGLRRRWLAEDPHPMVLRPSHRRERYTLIPDAEGRFGEEALRQAREAFRYRRDNETTDVHPRLLEVAYRAVQRFRAPWVTIVSGFRTTRATSRHNQGRAMDIVLPGVSDRRLAAYLRQQGFVGVGIYTQSGFTHLDVRERSYFWIDHSLPGRRSRARPIMRRETWRQDSRARRRGEVAVPDLVIEGERPNATE